MKNEIDNTKFRIGDYFLDTNNKCYFRLKSEGTNILCDDFGDIHMKQFSMLVTRKIEIETAKRTISNTKELLDSLKKENANKGNIVFFVDRTNTAIGIIEDPVHVENGVVTVRFIVAVYNDAEVIEGLKMGGIALSMNKIDFTNERVIRNFLEKLPVKYKAYKYVSDLYDEYMYDWDQENPNNIDEQSMGGEGMTHSESNGMDKKVKKETVAKGLKNDFKDDKLRWDLLPMEEIEDVVRVYHAGAKKYSENSWQNLENGFDRYRSALLRHMMEYMKGERIDPDTGCYHLAQVVWNGLAMLWFDKHGKGLIDMNKERKIF